MSAQAIEDFYADHIKIYNYLLEKGELSHANNVNDNFRRSLVLAIASYFEHELTAFVKSFVHSSANQNDHLYKLIESAYISRKYHTWFGWDNGNGGKFFELFGAECQKKLQRDSKNHPTVSAAYNAFIELGQTRNRLVHMNYVLFDVQKAPDDIIKLFRSALDFLKYLQSEITPPTAKPADAVAANDQSEG